jgi:hypothetical protein
MLAKPRRARILQGLKAALYNEIPTAANDWMTANCGLERMRMGAVIF